MADELGFRIFSDATLGAMRDVEKEIERANAAAVRAAGRALAKQAQSRAPVYQGQRRDVPKGRLRRSIKAGKVRKTSTGAAVFVGPRGQRVWLYAGQEEARQPYMSPAYAAMAHELEVIAAKAYTDAINHASRR